LLLSLAGCSVPNNIMPAKKAKIDFINTDHVMERVTFNGGFLRSEPEINSSNTIYPLLKGTQGMLYGKRKINGKEWAKVTTREGYTGWYTASDVKERMPISLCILIIKITRFLIHKLVASRKRQPKILMLK